MPKKENAAYAQNSPRCVLIHNKAQKLHQTKLPDICHNVGSLLQDMYHHQITSSANLTDFI